MECGVEIYSSLFGGAPGMLVVDSSGFDPDVLLGGIAHHGTEIGYAACKVNGTDCGDVESIRHTMNRFRANGLKVGRWIWNTNPAQDMRDMFPNSLADISPDFVVWNIEKTYKADEGGVYGYAAELVKAASPLDVPQAVTSYGGYKSSIDFETFSETGWSIIPQCYDGFGIGDAQSYSRFWPASAIHPMLRQLKIERGQLIYRPEGLDYAA